MQVSQYRITRYARKWLDLTTSIQVPSEECPEDRQPEPIQFRFWQTSAFTDGATNDNVLYHSSSVIQRLCDTDTIEWIASGSDCERRRKRQPLLERLPPMLDSANQAELRERSNAVIKADFFSDFAVFDA